MAGGSACSCMGVIKHVTRFGAVACAVWNCWVGGVVLLRELSGGEGGGLGFGSSCSFHCLWTPGRCGGSRA